MLVGQQRKHPCRPTLVNWQTLVAWVGDLDNLDDLDDSSYLNGLGNLHDYGHHAFDPMRLLSVACFHRGVGNDTSTT